MRTHREIDADRVTVALLLLITQRVGKACPTHREIRLQTGLPKRRVWSFLDGLRDRGVIDIEERGCRPGNWRRMRIAGGRWTDWTAREIKLVKGRARHAAR
jgi:hypothetical protein